MLPWAVATALAAAIVVILVYFDIPWLEQMRLLPWETARTIDTVRAINEFSDGLADMGPYWEGRLGALAGLLLVFVVGPTLWICSEAINEKREAADEDDELKKGFLWYVGAVIMIGGLLYAIPMTAVKGYYFQDMWESAERSRSVDQVRSELMSLAFEVAEQHYLRRASEGIGTSGGVDLKKLESFPEGSENVFIIERGDTDSVWTIYGITPFEGSDTGFKNADGRSGRIQLAVEVKPDEGLMEFVRQGKEINTR